MLAETSLASKTADYLAAGRCILVFGDTVYPVEFFGRVPDTTALMQVVVKLTDELMSTDNVRVGISVRGVESNRAVLSIKPFGSP